MIQIHSIILNKMYLLMILCDELEISSKILQQFSKLLQKYKYLRYAIFVFNQKFEFFYDLRSTVLSTNSEWKLFPADLPTLEMVQQPVRAALDSADSVHRAYLRLLLLA
jgi:hypothetical protein